jgi:hypothetical protein
MAAHSTNCTNTSAAVACFARVPKGYPVSGASPCSRTLTGHRLWRTVIVSPSVTSTTGLGRRRPRYEAEEDDEDRDCPADDGEGP